MNVDNNLNITSFIEEPPYKKELNKLLLEQIITETEYNKIINSNFNPYMSDLILFLDKLNKLSESQTTEIRKKILENKLDFLKISSDKIRLSPSKIKKLLYKNKLYKFTSDQKIGIKKLVEFLIDPTKKIFGFFGFAGTGKTTTLSTLVFQFIKLNMYKKITLVAPTNKAVMVIKNKFLPFLTELTENTNISTDLSFDIIIEELKSKGIYIDFLTIHKLLQIKTDFDSNGKIVFISNDKPEISQYDLIIIDECSMISIPMIDQLLCEIRKNNVKVIFSGDPAQLPPINEKLSSLFMNHRDDLSLHKYRDTLNRDKDKNIEMYTHEFLATFLQERHSMFITDILNMNKYTLSDVVRTKKENITKTCLLIRQWIENRFEFPPLEKYKDSDGVFFYDTENDWVDNSLKQFKKNQHNNIILTWTNSKATEYNNKIRQTIFKSKDLKRFEIGEILILNDFYYIKTDKDVDTDTDNINKNKNKNNNKVIYTSEHIRVNSVNIVTKKLNLFQKLDEEINFKKLKNDLVMRKRYDEFIETIIKHYKLTYKCYELTVNKIGDSKKENLTVYVLHNDDFTNYTKIIQLISGHIKKFLTKNSTDLIREKLVNDVLGKPIWKHFHDVCVEPFANVSYGYAITCHKAQGSNYYNVFVDCNDIMKNNKESEMRRCLYTALTRTENEMHVLF